MINPQNITKRYYKIGEVAEMFDVATSLIRYWESEFKQLKPLKSKSGIRRYKKEDILLIDRIYELVRNKGYTLEGAKKALKKPVEPGRANSEHLSRIRMELNDIKNGLVKLRDEIRNP